MAHTSHKALHEAKRSFCLEPEPMECGDLTPSEAEQADLSYLTRRWEILRQQRDAVGQMELDALRRGGWL